jgi:hypothetical protein
MTQTCGINELKVDSGLPREGWSMGALGQSSTAGSSWRLEGVTVYLQTERAAVRRPPEGSRPLKNISTDKAKGEHMLRNTRILSIVLLTLVALSGTMLAAREAPRQQEAPAQPEAPPQQEAPPQTGEPESPPPLVDINSAPLATIGQVVEDEELAAKIIEGRPYANKRQILSRELVTAEHYERIKERIIARRIQETPPAQSQ